MTFFMGGGPVCFPETTPQLTKHSESKIKSHTVLKKCIKIIQISSCNLGHPPTQEVAKNSGVSCLFLLVEEIRRKIRRPGINPAVLRRLGPYVTKEELESIYQKNESITRIFDFKMLLF